jgi:uncharacterized protein
MENCHIQVFAKAPVAGRVKTRLIPALGVEGAARLHQQLVRHTLVTACAAQPRAVELWCAPDCSHDFFVACAKEFGVTLHVQQGNDLGEKMAYSLVDGLNRAGKILLIGTDCPAITAAELHAAADTLRNGNDAVFIPVTDGGYGLVGAGKNIAPAFAHIQWSTAHVIQQTRGRLQQANIRWQELPELWDVDTPQDLAKLALLPAFSQFRDNILTN